MLKVFLDPNRKEPRPQGRFHNLSHGETHRTRSESSILSLCANPASPGMVRQYLVMLTSRNGHYYSTDTMPFSGTAKAGTKHDKETC